MCNYFQTGLVLSYVLATACASLLMLQLSGLSVSVVSAWLGLTGWLSFCFSSSFFILDIHLFFHGKIRKPILEEEEKLQQCFREVLRKASVDKTFRLMIEEEMGLNAFAAGHHTIVVSRGLLEQMTEDELKGVLAHELGHLVSRDTVIASAFITAGLLPGIIIHFCRLAGLLLRTGFFLSGRVQTGIGLLKIGRFSLLTGILFLLIAGYLLHRIHMLQAVIPVVAFALLFSILNAAVGFFNSWLSRFNEFRQDAYACRLGFGSGLRQALYKLAAADVQPVNPFFIVLNDRHPVIYNRIRRLEKLEGLRV